MTLSLPLRAATVALLALGLSALGTQAALADDDAPSADAATAAVVETPAGSAPAESAQSETAPSETDTAESVAADAAPVESVPVESTPTEVLPPAETAPAPAADATPYKLLVWKLPCGIDDRFCAPGQMLVHVIDLATPGLGAADDLIIGACGDFQVDLAYDSATTAALIAGGVLLGPNSPTEDLAYDALGAGVDPFKVVDNPDCQVGGSVVTSVVSVDQSCVGGTRLVGGRIVVPVITGVTYSITGPAGTVAFDATSGVAADVAPGAYSVAFTLDPGFTTPVTGPFPVTIAAFPASCAAVVTPPTTPTTPVDPADPQLDPSVAPAVTPAVITPAAVTTTRARAALPALAVTGDESLGGVAILAAGALGLGLLLALPRRSRRTS